MGKRNLHEKVVILSCFWYDFCMNFMCPCGGMVYAHGLEPCGSNPLEVRVLSGAPTRRYLSPNLWKK